MIKKLLTSLLLIFVISLGCFAQELRCNISVNGSSIKGANQQLFKTMRTDLYDFMNDRKWTDNVFEYNEKIKCSIIIKLDEQVSNDEFKGSIQVQLTRPIFNASYTSTILNIKDNDFYCKYQEYQPLEFSETSFRDNLTSILAFYAYIIIGFDYDTFSPEGGTEYFKKAQTIANNAQSSGKTGWRSYDSEYNRYWLIENVLNKSYSGFRDCMYEYHRKGLDRMSDSPQEGRAVIATALRDIQKVFRRKSTTYILQVFFDAKSDEINNIFSESYSDERTRVLTILNEVDPSDDYSKITDSD